MQHAVINKETFLIIGQLYNFEMNGRSRNGNQGVLLIPQYQQGF
jgi:hypothetical protein